MTPPDAPPRDTPLYPEMKPVVDAAWKARADGFQCLCLTCLTGFNGTECPKCRPADAPRDLLEQVEQESIPCELEEAQIALECGAEFQRMLCQRVRAAEEHARILNGCWDDARARQERAEAESAKLRQCLKDLLDAVDYDVGPIVTADATNHARAALGRPSEPRT